MSLFTHPSDAGKVNPPACEWTHEPNATQDLLLNLLWRALARLFTGLQSLLSYWAEAEQCLGKFARSCDCESAFPHFSRLSRASSTSCVACLCTLRRDLSFPAEAAGSAVTQGPRRGPAVRASVQPFPAQTVGKWRPRFRPTRLANILQQASSFPSCFLEPPSKYNPLRMVDFPPTRLSKNCSSVLTLVPLAPTVFPCNVVAPTVIGALTILEPFLWLKPKLAAKCGGRNEQTPNQFPLSSFPNF